MKIVATDRKGATRDVEGRDGWSVMEILRDAGFESRRNAAAPAPARPATSM